MKVNTKIIFESNGFEFSMPISHSYADAFKALNEINQNLEAMYKNVIEKKQKQEENDSSK